METICLKDRDLYKKIIQLLNAKRQEELRKPKEERNVFQHKGYVFFDKIGLCSASYYEVERFANNKPMQKGKTKPLHENKLKLLCEKVGIKYKATCFLVDMPIVGEKP